MQAAGTATMAASSKSSASPSSPEQKDANGGPLSIVFSASWVKLQAPIGEGAFSRVHEGIYRNPETLEESVVAVKILKRSMLKRRSDCLRFIKEAKIMTKISHRHIAACYGIGKYDDDDPHNPGSLFIVQELIRGGNLLHKVYKQMLNRHKCIYTSQEALNWMMDVASGMQYLHAVADNKPMIIHRDLKLENIMLAPTSNGVCAKLVDFGLHKVIDDRIKKVVKRVISEANLGGRLRGLRAAHAAQQTAVDEDFDPEDELEAALAEQRAMVVASSVKPGVGPAAASPLGSSPRASHRATHFAAGTGGGGAPKSRMQSEARSSMASCREEVDEEELAIQEAQRQAAEARAKEQGQQGASEGVRTSPQESPTKPTRMGSQQLEGDGKTPAGTAPTNTTAQDSAGPSPALAKIRAPVKKQSSMQKLMAKMKEIKLRVTGKDPANATPASNLSRGVGIPTATDSHSPPPSSPHHHLGPLSPSQGPLPGSPTASPKHTTTAGANPSATALEERRARNVQLLDRIVAQQSVAAGEGKSSVMDDLGLVETEAAARTRHRAPPRRAVTMINEIRYNLTEAVGSWAYMAPEVVLGQPYNEKVDVFSFGVILFEVLNRKLMLVDEIKNDPRKDAQAYAERVARGFRPEIPKSWPEGLQELISACWHQDPHCRPNFAAVVDSLQEIDSEGIVSKLDVRFMSHANAFI